MASAGDIARELDEVLRVSEIPDYPGAFNGLQLENGGREVGKIAAAVDACLPVVEKAVEAGADLLVVHHGMFWGPDRKICGSAYRKLRLAIESGLAIYSAHIPLDVHPRLGNNVLLARALGLKSTEAFFPWKGILLGRRAAVRIRRDTLRARLHRLLGEKVHLAPGGPATVRSIGLITGGAGSEVAAAAAEGIDTFITGEGPHHTYGLAEELGVNLFYGGHYATETFGVQALARKVRRRFGIPWEFIDHPSGL